MYAQPTLNGTPFVPTTYANITTFGQTSVQIIPLPATYQSGYLAGQGFPAENENYLMYNLTNAVNAISNDLANIHAEILSVLSGQSIPPDNSHIQLNAAIGSKITSTITSTYINNALTGAGINTALVAYGGNLGIGKSPSYTLDVNGNINGNSIYISGVQSINTSHGITVLTSGTSYTVPSGVFGIYVTTIGGGGGGGGAFTAGCGGGGGGSSKHVTSYVAVTPGSVINYSIGLAGIAGAIGGFNGGDGGTTTFTGATSSLPGLGGGGGGGSSSPGGLGPGGDGSGTLTIMEFGGTGGGPGGRGTRGVGGNAPDFGGGGGGAGASNNLAGGSGGAGCIIIQF